MSRVLDPAQTEAELCEELRPVLARIGENLAVGIACADFDLKAIQLDIRLTRDLSEAEVAALAAEFGARPGIEFGPNWISCRDHWQSISLRSQPDPAASSTLDTPRSVWQRIRSALSG